MDYSGYSNYGYSTEVSHGDDAATSDEPDRSGAENPDSRFDLLSFVAAALQRNVDEEEKWTTLVFFSIHLGPWNMFQPWTFYSGASFSVTLLSRKFLIRQTIVDLDYFQVVRRLLAIKTPKLRPEDQSSHNSKLLRSLAKEYQILKTEPLANHENIVTAYGCSWQTLPTGPSQPTPTLILEGTTFGDLSNFSRSRSLTLRERLRLCMDVTSGLDALHTHGVIHGDLKPNNILVFNSGGRGYTAKLADFGLAVLLSETTCPCRAPPGTKAYRAPECADGSVRLGRDDLVKTDLFSLGVTLAFLLVGSHIVDDIMALSGSDLQSLKEENQLAAWIAPHHHDDSAGGSDWVTDPSWNESSIFADYDLSCWYTSLCGGLLAADARQRPESAKVPAMALRHMLRRHMQTLLPRSGEAASEADGFAPSPAFWARRAADMKMSKARLRNLGGRVLSKTRISKVETVAIAHCCNQPGSYLKEAKFIIERNTGNEFKRKRHSKKWHTKRAFSKPPCKRAWIPAEIVGLANKMAHYVEESIDDQIQQLMDLKIVSLQKTMFKPSQENNYFWMFPRPVRDLLESQLLQDATDARNTDADRADAAYEYGVVVLNANDPAEARIDSALELLTFAAQNGQVEAQASVGRLSDVFGRSLAASRDEEMEWLLAASRAGSATAQRRFRDLDIEGFTAAMRDIRQGNGATCPLLNQAMLVNSRRMRPPGGLADIFCGCLHESAITGNVGLLLEIPPELPSAWYECENKLGETPLVVACRGGHTTVVEVLLTRGANAAHGTKHGVTPLHFLAAFDDDDIPGVASALLQHGADVDKVCERELVYKELFDSPFGQAGGTPLLWAVAAGNHCAVRALLARGADPFAMERHPPRFTRYPFRESPITRAVLLHQLDLLETIVDASGDESDFRKRFITESAGPHSQGYQALCHALDCHPGFQFREYILHGREYQCVALSCVSLLVESGVDPTRFMGHPQPGRRSEITHPITGASMSGNTAILRYLWGYQNGILRPTPKLWVTALSQSVFEGLRAGFDFLIDRRDDVAADVSSDVTAVVNTLSLTKDPYFTVGVLRLIQGPGVVLTPEDAFFIFFSAITMDHFEVARQVLETHNISLTKRTGGVTLLYRLIAMSYDFPNMESKISFVMSLSADKDTLFWNIGYLDNTGLTALQCAAHMPIKKRPANFGVFATVLKHFGEPKYLNAQLKSHPHEESAGYTALHLAVRCGNFDAVTMLVKEPGIETNLQSSRGETPIDICVNIAQHCQMEEQMSFQVDEAQKNRSTVNMSILHLLLNAEDEGRIAKYSTLLLRRTEDEFTLVDAIKGKLYGVKLRVETWQSLAQKCHELPDV